MRNKTKGNIKDFVSFLGEGTEFKGTLTFEGTVRIDGKLEGEVSTKDTLIMGDRAIVQAEINVGCIDINGKINGNITAKKRVTIGSSGDVYGNIKSPVLVIEEGAVFHGNCKMKHLEKEKIPRLTAKLERKVTS